MQARFTILRVLLEAGQGIYLFLHITIHHPFLEPSVVRLDNTSWLTTLTPPERAPRPSVAFSSTTQTLLLTPFLSHNSASAGFVSIVPDEEKGVLIHLDRSKVLTVGVPAIEAYLRKIQVYKSTADYAAYVLREKTMF